MKFHSDYLDDYDRHGFNRDDLLKFLSSVGVNLDGGRKLESESIEVKSIPEWVKSCKAIKRFTLFQAARVILGIDPIDRQWPGDDGQREIEKLLTAMSQACEDDELSPVGRDEDGYGLFRAQDLRAWALSVGFDWCIPLLDEPVADERTSTDPDPDPDAAHRLRQLEAENARLAEQVAQLQRQLQEATAAPQQAPQEEGLAPQQATAAQQDDEKPLHPKREKTYLNTIGALVELIQSPRPGRGSDAAVIRELLENYGERPGISERTLQSIFPAAKKSVQSN